MGQFAVVHVVKQILFLSRYVKGIVQEKELQQRIALIKRDMADGFW